MPTRSRTSRRKPSKKSSAGGRAGIVEPMTGIGAAGAGFQRLVDIMAHLRGPSGCPWDREQTIESLRGFVLEETYEVLDAIDRGDHEDLRREIGDLLFEGVFLAQIETDEGRYNVSASLSAISGRLIGRDPHILA